MRYVGIYYTEDGGVSAGSWSPFSPSWFNKTTQVSEESKGIVFGCGPDGEVPAVCGITEEECNKCLIEAMGIISKGLNDERFELFNYEAFNKWINGTLKTTVQTKKREQFENDWRSLSEDGKLIINTAPFNAAAAWEATKHAAMVTAQGIYLP